MIEDTDVSFGYRLRGINSIMIVELFGIFKALIWMRDFMVYNNLKQFVIITDSMAALRSLENTKKKERSISI